MPAIPPINAKSHACLAPHVVILGAGASVAAFPKGDRNGKKLPAMSNLVEVVGLKSMLEKHHVPTEITDFELFYDELATSGENPTLVREIENEIRLYFTGMELPDQATLYDYLLLSLREKDLVATFNWDPFLAQAYRRNRDVAKLPQIVFLHGNVQVGTCLAHTKKGWLFQTCPECGEQMEPSQLLYPVRRKDYNADGFIKNEWDVLRCFLNDAYFVTVFGYSAPKTDIEAKKLMLDQWQDNQIRWLAQIEVVDVKPRLELESTWHDFLITRDYRRNYAIRKSVFQTQAFRYTRRSCDALAMATLQQEPFSENPFPRTKNLRKLQNWLKPLIQEENNKCFSGKRTSP